MFQYPNPSLGYRDRRVLLSIYKEKGSGYTLPRSCYQPTFIGHFHFLIFPSVYVRRNGTKIKSTSSSLIFHSFQSNYVFSLVRSQLGCYSDRIAACLLSFFYRMNRWSFRVVIQKTAKNGMFEFHLILGRNSANARRVVPFGPVTGSADARELSTASSVHSAAARKMISIRFSFTDSVK